MLITAEQEAAHRVAAGCERVTLRQMDSRLAALGFKRDPYGPCVGLARYITGERAGQSYMNANHGVFDREIGKSAFHVNGRRDARYYAMQAMRQNVFAVVGDTIHGI